MKSQTETESGSPSLSMSHNSDKPIRRQAFSGLYCGLCGKPVESVLRGRPRIYCGPVCRGIAQREKGQTWIPGTL